MKKQKLAGILIAAMVMQSAFSGFAAGGIKTAKTEDTLDATECMATGSEADREDEKLPEEAVNLLLEEKVAESAFFAPENPRIELDQDGQLVVMWDDPDRTDICEYLWVFNYNGEGFRHQSIMEPEQLDEYENGAALGWGEILMNYLMTEAGDTLEVRVTCATEEISYEDVESVPEEAWAYSDVFVYEPVGEKLPQVENVHINDDATISLESAAGNHFLGYYISLWERDADDPYDEGYEILGSTDRWNIREGVGTTEPVIYEDPMFKNSLDDSKEYQVKIYTLANLNEARNSDPVASPWWSPTDGESETIDSLLEKEGDELVEAVESTVFEGTDLGELRTELIASDSLQAKYEKLETAYMDAAGVSQVVYDTGDTDFDESSVKTVGAGLNQIETIRFAKEPLPETRPEFIKENAVSMDITALKGDQEQEELQYPIVITMPVPEGMDAEWIRIYHYMDNGEMEWIRPRDNGDGTISFAITHFSTFVFVPIEEGGYDPADPDTEEPSDPDVDEPSDPGEATPSVPEEENPAKPGGTSGSSSSNGGGSSSGGSAAARSNGNWKQDERGWWFEPDGASYPRDSWYECYWDGKMNWYRFDAEGYLVSGWFTDQDGNTYFLHDQHDNRFGYMYKGWNWIGGKCYYFTPYQTVGGLPVGALVKNSTTADGYTVDATGVWTVDGVVQTR